MVSRITKKLGTSSEPYGRRVRTIENREDCRGIGYRLVYNSSHCGIGRCVVFNLIANGWELISP